MKRQIILAILCSVLLIACDERAREQVNEVVIYVSTDRVFSEPVLKAFESKTGIKVKAVYDTEETKSTGLANRLLAEKDNPQTDVFWSGEPVRTIVLKQRGVLTQYKSPSADGIPNVFKDPDGYWTGFSARSRIILYNTKLVRPEEAPKSIFDFTDPKWKGQAAIANPLFGSTSFHSAAIFVELGDERAEKFFRDLKANDVKIVDGNSVVRQAVETGEVKVGLTDTDDANVSIQAGKPVAVVYPDESGMGVAVMPNMVSLIKGGPNPENGKKMIDFLLSPETEKMLAQSEAVQMPLHKGVEIPANVRPIDSIKPMTLDYASAASRVEEVTRRLQGILGL